MRMENNGVKLKFLGDLFVSNRQTKSKIFLKQNFSFTFTLSCSSSKIEENYVIPLSDQHSDKKSWHINKSLLCPYIFTEKQQISIALVFHEKDHVPSLTWSGCLLDIITKNEGEARVRVEDQKGELNSFVTVKWIENIQMARFELAMQWRAANLCKIPSSFMEIENTAHAYLRFLKGMANGTFVEATRTEINKKNNNPHWKEVIIPISKIFDLSLLLPFFKVECWHYNENADHHNHCDPVLIGESKVEFNIISSGNEDHRIFVMKDEKSKENRGNLIIKNCKTYAPETFLSTINTGLKLTFNIVSSHLQSSQNKHHHLKFAQIVRETWSFMEPYIEKRKGQKRLMFYHSGTAELFGNVLKRIQNISSNKRSSIKDHYHQEKIRLNRTSLVEGSCRKSILRSRPNKIEIKSSNLEHFLSNFGEENMQGQSLLGSIKQLVSDCNSLHNLQSYHIALIFLHQKIPEDFIQVLSQITSNSYCPISFIFFGFDLDAESINQLQILNREQGRFIGERKMTYFRNLDSGNWKEGFKGIPQHILEYMRVVEDWGLISPELEKKKSERKSIEEEEYRQFRCCNNAIL